MKLRLESDYLLSKKKQQIRIIPLKIIIIFILSIVAFSIYYSTINIKLLEFDIKKENEDLYTFDIGQEVEIIISAESKGGLIIDSLYINGDAYLSELPASIQDESSLYFYYQGDTYKNKIKLTYIIKEHDEEIILNNVKLRSGRFFNLGNKFLYNDLESIKIQTK